MTELNRLSYLDRVHAGAPLDWHVETLFGGLTVEGQPFLPLYRRCMERSGTATTVSRWKMFRRMLRAFQLACYFERALAIDGAWVECGVFRGFSALLLAELARIRRPGFCGQDFHLVDSFQGLSAPTAGDAIEIRTLEDGTQEGLTSMPAGHFATPEEHVRAVLAEFPDTALHAGWIPAVFAGLPERRWAFVHVDVDLFEPTLACLDYFVPRLAPGGVLINDDYASPLFPGGGRAWDRYFSTRNLPFVALDSGQAIYVQA